MDYPKFVASNQKEESISALRVKKLTVKTCPLIPESFGHGFWITSA